MQQRKWRQAVLAVMLLVGAAQARAQTITFNALPALQATSAIPGSNRVPGDVDGNGVSDVFWFNPTTSQFGYWLMDVNDTSGIPTRIGERTFNVTQGYFVGAIGDFNGDGKADVAFTSNNHDLYLWLNNGQGGFTSKQIDSYPAGWILLGAGDVDGDGQDDLLWLDPAGCQFGYWIMRNGVHVSSKIVKVACGYYPVSIGYYTPTNRISIIWSSAANDLYAWDSGTNGFASYSLSTIAAGSNLYVLGGGYGGSNMGVAITTPEPTQSITGETDFLLSRAFNGTAQTSYTYRDIGVFSDPYPLTGGTGGFLVEGRGFNLSGQIYLAGGTTLSVCTPTLGLPPANRPFECASMTYPSGWYAIGGMVNGIKAGITQ